jgi:trk system potassium uptake protein TrkH
MKRISSYIGAKISTAQTLIFGYFIFILFGSFLLMLPISIEGDETLSFIDSVFTTTSAISGTGLTVEDTGTYFSLFGQAVILLLIQVGNIGYMIFFALAVVVFGGRLSLFNKLILKESISHSKLDLKQFVIKVVKYTFVIEAVTALLLAVYWMQDMPVAEAIKQGVFHSISAFCTAGFSLFPDNLMGYRDDYFVNAVIIAASFAGCIGFFVVYDLSSLFKATLKRAHYKLSTHSRLALYVSLSIIVIGTILIYFVENVISHTGEASSFLESFFQSASASSSVGFNTVDIGKLERSSLMGIIIEMFIGASPSGTGGGVKTTVFAIMCLSLITFIRDRKNVNIMHRSVHPGTIARAFSICFFALFWLVLTTMFLNITEEQQFLSLMFEASSALGNNGLSTGITGSLSIPGKIILSLSMLIGRVGPLIVGYTLLGKRKAVNYSYPEGNILIV